MKIVFDDLDGEDAGQVAAALIRRVQEIVDDHGADIAPGDRERIAETAAGVAHAIDTVEALEALDLADDLEDRRKETS